MKLYDAMQKADAKGRVTKAVTKPVATVTQLRELVTKVGRPRIHATKADKQRAYRKRKRLMVKARNLIADRLERLAERLTDMAERIRPRTVYPPGYLSEIILATLRNRSAELAENVTRNNALLRELGHGRH